jgi:hypothetical protein
MLASIVRIAQNPAKWNKIKILFGTRSTIFYQVSSNKTAVASTTALRQLIDSSVEMRVLPPVHTWISRLTACVISSYFLPVALKVSHTLFMEGPIGEMVKI